MARRMAGLATAALVVTAAAIAIEAPPRQQEAQIVALQAPRIMRPTEDTSATRPVAVRPMPLCHGATDDCVVDGDTFWLGGEKIRIESIDAPEIKGRCAFERDLAARATKRLSVLLSGSRLGIERSGRDRYGRTLARVATDRGEAGAVLVAEGLARRWTGRKERWCDA